MFFTKFPHPANFTFAKNYSPENGRFVAGNREFGSSTEVFEDGIHRIRVTHEDWGPNRAINELNIPPKCSCQPVSPGSHFELSFRNDSGHEFLRTNASESFGVCGQRWLVQFCTSPDTRFYGLGEKNYGRLELSGIRTKFWNTDVWGDFHYAQFKDNVVDPPYLSIPYVILNRGDEYFGILVDSPSPVFVETPGKDESRTFEAWKNTNPLMIVGGECGEPTFWVIYGPSLKELTRKLQRLVGMTPVPPTWALGYHQSRWGYAGHNDLVSLDEKFREHEFPCDGLWLDIDYMDGFRVFTFDKEHFPNGIESTIEQIAKSGRKVVAILDPGVKKEAGYPVYDDLKKKKLYCFNPEGGEYVGIVWPGETVFPDLTMEKGREWWATFAEKLFKTGMGGVWLDMNDPSTGPVDPTDMLFRHGKDPHAFHRNQYALGMQMATHEGFVKANPNQRPFFLSRSGCTGTSKYSAIWTGDNFANYFHLQLAIPTTLNLSLSGVCFNGPDLGGFGGTTTEQLMCDWVKTCCFFPFLRNHNSKGEGDQEPWAFSASGLNIIRKYIRLRYRLLPYLYNLYCDQAEIGDPILRPLIYEFPASENAEIAAIADQFMVGPHILQAPFVQEKKRMRKVVLPGASPWFDAISGHWHEPSTFKVKSHSEETPMYFRQGAIVPLRPGVPKDNVLDLANVDVLILARPGTSGESRTRYRADDGKSLDYMKGKRSETLITATWGGDTLAITEEAVSTSYGPIDLHYLVPKGFETVTINGEKRKLKETSLELTGPKFEMNRVH